MKKIIYTSLLITLCAFLSTSLKQAQTDGQDFVVTATGGSEFFGEIV